MAEIFDDVDVQSSYLKHLVKAVLERIRKHSETADTLYFGKIREGLPIFEGSVTEEGTIYLNPAKLANYPDEVAQAIVAHELAHYHLEHFRDNRCTRTMACENEADDLAKRWGFNVDKLRKVISIESSSKRE
ncbi:MAG: hypothetical protein R6U50_01610 [Desulfobacterales bacterium]